MKTAIVHHPDYPDISEKGYYSHFVGEEMEVLSAADGKLMIKNWQTDTESGFTIFAKGAWACVSLSEPRRSM